MLKRLEDYSDEEFDALSLEEMWVVVLGYQEWYAHEHPELQG